MSGKPIVAATDGSPESLRAVDWAVREAALHGAPLRIVSAAALMPAMIGGHAFAGFDALAEDLRAHRDRALRDAVERVTQAAPGLLVDADSVDGPPAETVAYAGHGALMLVVGSRGAGEFAAMILGSVSRYAATHAPCPVAVVRPAAGPASGQIGVGIDEAANTAALTFAFEEAVLRRASLIALHSWHIPDVGFSRAGPIFSDEPMRHAAQAEAASRLTTLLDPWRAKYPAVAVSQEPGHGHPARALADLSARTDLVVLGRRSVHHGPASVTHTVLSHAHGPVVTVPPAG
jgi:nucleotide-binding universal stress UspA family protein